MQRIGKKRGTTLRNIALAGTAGASITVLGACDDGRTSGATADRPSAGAPGDLLPPASVAGTAGCGNGGALRTELIGALQGDLDLRASELQCEGMPRPHGEGARLRFAAGDADDDSRLAIIIGLPGLKRAMPAKELDSTVTLIEEGGGRFFTTPGPDTCWTDIDAQDPLPDARDTYAIIGTTYCIAPLAEVNGDGSVSLTELSFTGLVNWGTR